MNRHECPHVDAGFAHPLKESVRHAPAAHVIVDESHLDALLGTVDECIADEASEGVVVNDVGVEVDVVARLPDGLQQRHEEIVAGGVDVDAIALER